MYYIVTSFVNTTHFHTCFYDHRASIPNKSKELERAHTRRGFSRRARQIVFPLWFFERAFYRKVFFWLPFPAGLPP